MLTDVSTSKLSNMNWVSEAGGSAYCHDWACCHGNILSRDILPGYQCIDGMEVGLEEVTVPPLTGDGAVCHSHRTELYLAFLLLYIHFTVLIADLPHEALLPG